MYGNSRPILFCDQSSSDEEHLIHLFLTKGGEVFHFLGQDIPEVCGVSAVTLNSPTSDIEVNKLSLFDGVRPIGFSLKDGSWCQVDASYKLSSLGIFGLARTKHTDKIGEFWRQAQAVALSQ